MRLLTEMKYKEVKFETTVHQIIHILPLQAEAGSLLIETP